jgi:TatD DNase family protein
MYWKRCGEWQQSWGWNSLYWVMVMALADSHVHLDWYAEPAPIIERARRADVAPLVGVSVDLASARRTIQIAYQYWGIITAIGFHPAYVPDDYAPGHLAELVRLASDPSVGCIGEIGIDTLDSEVPLDRQMMAFQGQLALANRLALPVNLHLRGDIDPALDLLARNGLAHGGIVHYFVGDEAAARRYLALGLTISVGKPVTRPENGALRQAITRLPLDRLVLETDSYPLPGRTTEPSDVVVIAREVAELRGILLEDVASVTTDNLRRLLPSRAWEWAARS